MTVDLGDRAWKSLDAKRARLYCTSELTGLSGTDSTGMLRQRLKWQEDNVCPLRQENQI